MIRGSWFGGFLPLAAAAGGEDVEPQLLDELNHLQFGAHAAAAGQDPPQALLGTEEFQRARADALVLGVSGEEEHEAAEGGHSFDELLEVGELVRAELVEHAQFLEEVHEEGLEVDVELDRVVLAAPPHLPVLINKFLVEDHSGHLRLGLPLFFLSLLGLLGDVVGGF